MGSMQDIDLDSAMAAADEKLKKAGIDPDASAVEEEGEEAGFLKINTGDGEGDDDNKGEEGDDSKGEGEDDNKDDDDKGGEGDDSKDDGKGDGEGATATDESGEEVTFKSAEALSKFVSEQLKTIKDKETTPEDAQAAKDALKSVKIFDKDWKPKDWNDALVQLFPHIRKMIKDEDAAEVAKTEAGRQEFNKRLDTEYDSLVKEKKIPPRTTEDGKRVNRELAIVGSAYGLGSYKTAFDIWSKLPKGTELVLPNGDKAKVGGLGGGTADTTTKKINPSKAASRRIAGNSTPESPAGAKKKVDYSKVHGRSMDSLLDEALEG